jgi:Arc/MetJ family transcription regulator
MMAKSMREAAGTLNPVTPVAGAWADVAQNIQTAGAEALYDILGDRQGIARMQQNYVPVTTGRFYQEPTTQLGKEFESGITKAMDASKIPAMWPMAMNQPIRPPITPNDVRVMGAEATRVGRQVRDIPTDFYNAQSGLQKLDPITGQPTMGAKLQGVAESVGDIMAQREMQGLPPIPGLPASMQPMNPKLYAMRPEGSRLTSAVIPETSKVSPYFAVTKELVSDVVGDGTLSPLQTLEDIQNRYLRQPNAEDARDAFFNFLQKKAVEMYPDAPSPGEALDAYKARFSDKAASAPHTLNMYNEFLQSPEGTALAARVDLPTAEEITARHETAVNWLNSQFTNYINEKVGTPNEPGIKLAGQGLTYAPRGDVMESAHTTDTEIQRRREQAGMPALTATDKALTAANTQLQTLQQQAIDALTAKREQTQAAIDAGYGAPGGPNLGQFEPFAQASRAADKATAALDKQRKLVDNLQLGAAYENAIDTSIKATPAGELLQKIPYEERQFYPALQKTPTTENAYTASIRQLKNLGFDDMARKFYDEVMDGSIPRDKVPKLTVEKYIRSVAEPRVAKERAEQAAQAGFKNAVDAQFKKSADAYIPNDKVFGNVGALEITNRFTPEEVAKLVSEDTTALDVCIGEGGIRRDIPNLWHPGTGNRQYVPIYNVATGERNPDAPSPRPTYINAVRDGSQMVSFRDTVTGEPVAIFDFNPSSIQGKYNINFASGRANGKIKPEYIDGIKSYLNSRADSIHDIGRNIDEHAGIYDSRRMTSRELAGMIDMPASQFERYDRSGLPRFITRADLRNYVENLKANEPVEQVPAVMSQRPSESLESYTTGAMSSAIDNVLDSQRRAFEEAGEGGRFQNSEDFFADIRGFFDEALREQGAVEALVRTKQHLYDLESQYANSNRVASNIIADGIQDLISDLQGHINYAIARQAAEANQQRPRPFAQRAEPAPEQAPDYLRMTHDAALQLDRQMGVDAGDELRSVFRAITEGSGLDPVRDTDQFIEALRGASEVAARGSVETALNELADDMYTAYIRDWEPEEAPAAQQPLDFARLVDGIVDEVSQNTNPGVGNRVETIAYRVAERTNPRLDPEGYAQALRRVVTDTDHVAVGPALRALADRVYMPAEEPARQPREADLANQRNDAMIQLENSLNDPELNPDDLRFLANGLSNPADQTANSPWIALTERERREYALALRERANYIEFSPADFAIRLSNEAGADIADLRDTVQALNDGTFDHEVLRGLPSIERDRAAQRTALNLNHILQGMQDDAGRRGNANGGPVPGYQAGGSVKKPEVKTPWLFSVPTYSETVAYEMYPGQKGQDDQRDAARHMLAAGTLSRKYGAGPAEFIGKAHEYVTSPLQAVKTLFGGKMPADFDMDTHNNAVGAQLGQRAKSQAELEDLVQAEAERASRTQTQDKAFIKKANGGIVQQNPTTDHMRYALMMRRK